MKSCIVGVSLVLALLAGCASQSQVASTREETVCLPPGIVSLPPASAIERVEAHQTPAGPGILVHYRTAAGRMQVLWIDGVAVAIDPKPEDPAVPVWIRSTRDGCHWTSELVGTQRT